MKATLPLILGLLLSPSLLARETWDKLDSDARYKCALVSRINELPYAHPYPDTQNRSAAELIESAGRLKVEPQADSNQALDAWRKQLAPLYHALEAQYATPEGKKEMDKRFAQYMLKWKATEAQAPPGMMKSDWDIDAFDEAKVAADPTKVVDWFFERIPYDGHRARQFTATILGHPIAAVETLSGLSDTSKLRPKWEKNLEEQTEEMLVVRIVAAYHYKVCPDRNHAFP